MFTIWCLQQESNLYPGLRRSIFCPLNYRDIVMVPSVRFEPTLNGFWIHRLYQLGYKGIWCERRDSNPHALRREILSLLCTTNFITLAAKFTTHWKTHSWTFLQRLVAVSLTTRADMWMCLSMVPIRRVELRTHRFSVYCSTTWAISANVFGWKYGNRTRDSGITTRGFATKLTTT